ncbi:MAG: hypothetical protein WD512_07745, partial [Candidatus Paceibacterota bacterium]
MKKLIAILIMTSLILGGVAFADSGDKDKIGQKKQVLQLLKKLKRTQNALAKKFNRLSDVAKADVISRTSNEDNSDDDLINDFIEGALDLNKCSSDSDDDGLDDSDEVDSGNDPSDDDSDDDGFEDGLEFEANGLIEAIDLSSVSIAGLTYILNDSTEYL